MLRHILPGGIGAVHLLIVVSGAILKDLRSLLEKLLFPSRQQTLANLVLAAELRRALLSTNGLDDDARFMLGLEVASFTHCGSLTG